MTALEGAQIKLTALRDDDRDAMFEWINDRELVVLNAPFKRVSRLEHDTWFEQIQDRDDLQIFGIRLVADDRLIGSCQLNEIDRDAGEARLQIRIGERHQWGRGLGTEAVGLLLAHAFGEIGLERIYLDVFADNERAIRAYEKAGFRHRDGKQQTVTIDDAPRALIEMSASRPDESG